MERAEKSVPSTPGGSIASRAMRASAGSIHARKNAPKRPAAPPPSLTPPLFPPPSDSHLQFNASVFLFPEPLQPMVGGDGDTRDGPDAVDGCRVDLLHPRRQLLRRGGVRRPGRVGFALFFRRDDGLSWVGLIGLSHGDCGQS